MSVIVGTSFNLIENYYRLRPMLLAHFGKTGQKQVFLDGRLSSDYDTHFISLKEHPPDASNISQITMAGFKKELTLLQTTINMRHTPRDDFLSCSRDIIVIMV